MKKVFFTQRLFAYLIDYLVVSLVLIACITLIGLFIPANPKENEAYDNFAKSYEELLTNPNDKDINSFYKEQLDNMYIIEKSNVISLAFGIIINIAYFGAFQFLNNGQTLGKKVTKIRVVSNNSKYKYTYLTSVLRAAFTYSVFTNLIICAIFIIMKPTNYFIPYFIISFGAFIFNFANAILIAVKKDGRGLPDMICQTKVENI